MAVPRIALLPLESPPTAHAEAQADHHGRRGSIGRAAICGWYVAIGLAAWLDAVVTGHHEALLASIFVAGSTGALLWAGQMNLERMMLRSLLVGLIGLAAGVIGSVSAPAGSGIAATCLCFGAMAMLFGVLMALPPALMTTLRSSQAIMHVERG